MALRDVSANHPPQWFNFGYHPTIHYFYLVLILYFVDNKIVISQGLHLNNEQWIEFMPTHNPNLTTTVGHDLITAVAG